MQFSPDWKHDAEASSWHDFKNSLRGRTAAVHKPWVKVNRLIAGQDSPGRSAASTRLATPSSPPRGPADGTWKDDPQKTIVYRSGLAYTQHQLPGGHYRDEGDGDMGVGALGRERRRDADYGPW